MGDFAQASRAHVKGLVIHLEASAAVPRARCILRWARTMLSSQASVALAMLSRSASSSSVQSSDQRRADRSNRLILDSRFLKTKAAGAPLPAMPRPDPSLDLRQP